MIGSYIYHEKQISSLCGVHCLNNLLQGSFFGPGDLAEIGIELDQQEQGLLAGRKERKKNSYLIGGAFLGWSKAKQPEDIRAETSMNVDFETGNFSFEVISHCLWRFGAELDAGFNIMSLVSLPPDASEQKWSELEGFICHQHEHWFCLRKVFGHWFNLDSKLEKPQFLSDTYLKLRLLQLTEEGAGIFKVQSQDGQDHGSPGCILPLPNKPSCPVAGQEATWHPLSYIVPEDAKRCQRGEMQMRPPRRPPLPECPNAARGTPRHGTHGEHGAPGVTNCRHSNAAITISEAAAPEGHTNSQPTGAPPTYGAALNCRQGKTKQDVWLHGHGGARADSPAISTAHTALASALQQLKRAHDESGILAAITELQAICALSMPTMTSHSNARSPSNARAHKRLQQAVILEAECKFNQLKSNGTLAMWTRAVRQAYNRLVVSLALASD